MIRTKQTKISLVLIASLAASLFGFAGIAPSPVLAASGDSRTIALKSVATDKYITAGSSGATELKANADKVWSGELFEMIEQTDGAVALKSRANNRYVTAGSSSSSALIATATSVGASEKFVKITNADATVSFKSKFNSYVSAPDLSSTITSAKTEMSTATKFQFTSFDFTKPLKILEIKDLEKPASGEANSVVSDLSSLLSTNSAFQLETMSIKKFVALRDELDGKYDAIYFGRSLFNPTSETGSNHNTRYEENDITPLKATEITEKYINKGLPVIVYSDSTQNRGALYQGYLNSNNNWTSLRGNLYTLFKPFQTTPKSNVIFINKTDIDTVSAFVAKTNLVEISNVRPQLNITSRPDDFTLSANREKKYKAGDTLTYTFDVSNVRNLSQRNLVANLYLGIDSVLKFDAKNLVQSVPVTSLTGNTISFPLPKGYSGLYYWRLELVDQTSVGKLKDSASGVFRYKDQSPTIQVLQVIPDSQSANQTSSLLLEANLRQNYLHSTDYEIAIKVIDFSTFNSTEFKTLNSKYDMLIFGFNDSYNGTAKISDTAADAVKAYIATGQGVMFTHDTVYQGNQTWITKFQTDTGQIGPMTNMGLNAPNTSTSTVKINEGLLTEFPFYISEETPQVATTHDQYFRLDLNDPKVIPWYNINGSARDVEDSWNHYYTYSKGNVTYSGTGHNFVNTTRNSSFPDWEQKLFVNTMYRAFIGSNHKPTLEILAPVPFSSSSKNYMSANSDISVSFKADDLDLSDKTTVSSIKLKYKNADGTDRVDTVLTGLEKPKGETVTRPFPNPLANRGGDLTISVTTADQSGALETKEVLVKVIKSTGLNPTRTLSNDRVEKNTPVTINYVVSPIAMDYNAAFNVDDLTIQNIHYKETLPANLEIISLPEGFTKTKDAAVGYTIEGNITNIPYRQAGNKFIADPKSFNIIVKPLANGDYALSDATLTFKDYSTVSDQSILFTNRLITAFTKLTTLKLDNVTIAKDDTTKLIPKYAPTDSSYVRDTDFTWVSDTPSIVTVDNTGVVTGKAAGVAKITATSKDGSGLSAVSTVSVIIPGLNITGPSTVNVNEIIHLQSLLVKASDSEKITSIQWISSNEAIAKFTSNNTDIGVLQGRYPGQITVTLIINTDKPKQYTQTYTVSVVAPITSLALDGDKKLEVGDQITLHAAYSPGYATNTSLNWLSTDTSKVSITTTGLNASIPEGYSTIKALAAGTSLVRVHSGSLTAESKIDVILPAINTNSTTTIYLGDEPSKLDVSNNFLNPELQEIRWKTSEESQNIVRLQADGTITALKVGAITGTVTVTYKGKLYEKNFTVLVENPVRLVNIERKDKLDAADTNASIFIDKDSSVALTAIIQRPDAIHTGFQWFIIQETGQATLDKNTTQDVTLTGTSKGTIKVKVLVGGKEDIRNVTITQNLTNVALPDGPIRLILNTNTSSYDLWPQTVISPIKWRDELKGRLEWKSDDPSIATVSGNGLVQGFKPGTTTVTLTYKDDPTILDTVRVIVIKQFDNRY
ncbi:hypothetical protein GCM10008018_38070 [Paenibacillus marchantiophytorum]|uniref:BIG2 domain-containing protein n=1 Tax=Paenibacillus marchantiophytorum TaxID=1619310 RepID=A0ABQ1EVH1_9BACL|nr:DUF5057 domain-containing protein [Paenibacillus marchantiophytorum]GFZ88301.1 hypothetical protein GCM10008018_38070 [Paenibacillus marchantiophytorum]